jgi:hypothetical protein
VIDPHRLRSVRVTMRTAILLCGLALLVAAGCGDDDDGGAAGGAAQGEAPARLADPITFEVIGGDAFRDDEITVRADGSARVETRAGERTSELEPDALAELARAVEQADLAGAESAVTEPPQPDALSYRFTYRGRQVTTDSGALPEPLEPLVGTFIGLIDDYGPS